MRWFRVGVKFGGDHPVVNQKFEILIRARVSSVMDMTNCLSMRAYKEDRKINPLTTCVKSARLAVLVEKSRPDVRI